MSAPAIHGKRRPITASSVLEAVGNDLLAIKTEDKLRWTDIGEVLGRSEDQAAKYADASAAMDIVAFAKGKAAWNGRFTGSLDKLVDGAASPMDAQEAQSHILKAALALSVALEDGELTVAEVRANRATLENAREAIERQLSRIGPRAA